MKKALALIAVVLMLSSAVVASPAGLIGLGGTPVQLTNLEENALINPALLGGFANKVVIGIEIPVPAGTAASGMIITNIGPGTLLVGAGNRAFGSVDFLSVGTSYNVPSTTFNLGYALGLDKNISVGLSVGYGVDNDTEKALRAGGVELDGGDETSTNRTIFRIAAGASLDVGIPLDASLSVALPGYYTETKDYVGTTEDLGSNPKTTFNGLDFALDAKTELAGLMLALNLTLSSLQYQSITWLNTDADDDPETHVISTSDDSSMDISLIAGKKIEASKTLNVLLSSGLNIKTNGAYKAVTEDKIADTKTYTNADGSSEMEIAIPFTLAVAVDLGKIWTISNDNLSATVGITKEVIVVNNYTNKTLDLTEDDPYTADPTDLSQGSSTWNNSPVVGAVGIVWELGESKVCASAGAKYLNGSLEPTAALDFNYAWK